MFPLSKNEDFSALTSRAERVMQARQFAQPGRKTCSQFAWRSCQDALYQDCDTASGRESDLRLPPCFGRRQDGNPHLTARPGAPGDDGAAGDRAGQ
jgi:hypothetical protein